MIMEKNAFDSYTIVTAAHPSMLTYDETVPVEDRIDYMKLKRDVKSWMCSNQQSQVIFLSDARLHINFCNLQFNTLLLYIIRIYYLQDCTVTIVFRPIFISPIDDGLFVTPPFGDLLSPLNSASMDSEFIIDHLVNLFDDLFSYLNLKEDIYSMGKFSEHVAEKLEQLPTAVDRRNVGALNHDYSNCTNS